ncbi:uncharacterized protein PV07_09143 [Cladophialophora immunda]|uniref:Uncharacterized protein n=1 Tax=Cladophialophora immunda TaxID=569365 RepID=A0A0D2C4D7_9EURO|nr:uncharacterized protein PV07_09143 [Cladophialophora immunda]KIW26013.1 hypothetical protein PV07_09143 [Cladophialophora immunda]OQU98028.1 hypothetical protein CLAIMM_03865 [Cladophialophora immunda]
MSSHPRRSARLSPHLQQEQFQQRSSGRSPSTFTNSFSQPSSASTSSHPSPVSDTLQPPPPPPTPQQPQHRIQIQSHFMPHQQQGHSHIHAPLPSPSAAHMGPFFGGHYSQPNTYASQQVHPGYQGQQPFGDQQPQARQQEQQHHLHPHTNSMSKEHPAYPQTMGPGQLPPDFLAEAAKRAQMACLMRDLGDVSL